MDFPRSKKHKDLEVYDDLAQFLMFHNFQGIIPVLLFFSKFSSTQVSITIRTLQFKRRLLNEFVMKKEDDQKIFLNHFLFIKS